MRSVAVLGFVLLLAACARTPEPRPDAEQPPAVPRTAEFTCDVPRGSVRSCVYAAARGRLRIDDSVGTIRRVYVDDRGQWRELPRFWGNTVWGTCAVPDDSSYVPRRDHVTIADLDGDGRDDVALVGYCTTGIGPTGAEPFAVGTIYMQRAPGQYGVDDTRDSTFRAALPQSCAEGPCDALAVARAALRSAALSSPALRAGPGS